MSCVVEKYAVVYSGELVEITVDSIRDIILLKHGDRAAVYHWDDDYLVVIMPVITRRLVVPTKDRVVIENFLDTVEDLLRKGIVVGHTCSE